MYRSLIALCTAATLCTTALAQPQSKGAATSLEVSPHGIGHMLIVPYFNTQGGNTTLLNLFNASAASKAVKIRFRGAGNGDELFSFQVFLWRLEAWTANISTGPNGLPAVTTSDRSCTLPAVINGERFRTARLNPALAGDALANEAREGYIEIIAMGDVIEGTPLAAAIMPPQIGGAPCTPTVLGSLTRFDAQLAPPSTGLMANWILINVPQTTTWSGEAVAYEARNNGAPSTGNNVFFPQTAVPLSGADVTSYTSDPLYNFANGGPIIAPSSLSLPDLSTPYTTTVISPQDQVTELSFQISAPNIVIEFLTDRSIRASTDWVVSMPTRRYHVAVDYRGPTLITNDGTFGDPGSVYFSRPSPLVSPSGQSCYASTSFSPIQAYDREGRSALNEFLAPLIPWYYSLCGTVSVISVGGETGSSSPTLQASATRSRLLDFKDGADGLAYLWWDFHGRGLPVLVRQFARAVNSSVAPGVSGTFGATSAGRTRTPGVLP